MRKIKILIIENDDDEQFFIRKGFLSCGLFEITGMLFSGMELLSVLRDSAVQRPDVILSDLNMYGMNGYDILDALKVDSELSTIPVIILSNAITPDIEQKCKERGAFSLKEKPEDFGDYDKFAKSLYEEVVDRNKLFID